MLDQRRGEQSLQARWSGYSWRCSSAPHPAPARGMQRGITGLQSPHGATQHPKKFGECGREQQFQVPHLQAYHCPVCNRPSAASAGGRSPTASSSPRHAGKWPDRDFGNSHPGDGVCAGLLLPFHIRGRAALYLLHFLKVEHFVFYSARSLFYSAKEAILQMLKSSPRLMLTCTQGLCKQEAERSQSFRGGQVDPGAHQLWLKNRSSRMCQGSGVPIKARLEGLWREETRSRGCPRSASVSSQQFIEQIRFHSQIRKWQWMAFTRWHV